MSDTGWVSPSSVSATNWTNSTNVYSSDDNRAGTSFSMMFAELDVALSYNGGTNYTSSKTAFLGEYPNDAIGTVGSSSDTWGRSWSVSEFSNTNFKVKIIPDVSDDYYDGVVGDFNLSIPTGATINGIEVGVEGYGGDYNTIEIDHIQIKVYYTESGTDASSERGLYTKGKNTGSSERGLYTKGYLTGNSERGMYLEGYVSSLYSKESSASLKTNDTNLANAFTQQEYTDVATDNDTYVDLIGTYEYFQFLFKEPNDNSTDDFRITWKGKSTVAPSSYPVYLQIYNRTTSSWTNLTSNSTASANTKFTLTYDVTTGMSDYYDANHVISARVYQDVVV